MLMEAPSGSAGRKLRCPGCRGIFLGPLPQAILVDEPAGPDAGVVLLEEEVPSRPAPARPKTPDPADLIGFSDAPSRRDPLPGFAPPPKIVPPAPAKSAEDTLDRLSAPKITVDNPRQWRIKVGGIPAVAVTYKDLQALAKAGKITPKTELRYEPKDLDLRARDLPGLFPAEDARREQQAKAQPQPHRKVIKVSRLPGRGPESKQADELADVLGHLEEGKEES